MGEYAKEVKEMMPKVLDIFLEAKNPWDYLHFIELYQRSEKLGLDDGSNFLILLGDMVKELEEPEHKSVTTIEQEIIFLEYEMLEKIKEKRKAMERMEFKNSKQETKDNIVKLTNTIL